MKNTKAIYAFSGDPITYGHINIIERASKIFDELIVGIGINPTKKYLFSIEERLQLAKDVLIKYKNVTVVEFRGLLVDYAFENNIPVIIRGLRNSEDFNMEIMLHQIGESQKANIETIFFPSNQNMSHISSGAVKALQLEQGFVYEYVPLNVKQKLEEKLSGQYIIGVTGEIASGKSYLCSMFEAFGKKSAIPVTVIDVDKIGHQILETQSEPLYKGLREEIASTFGKDLKNHDGFIDRKQLGKIIFNDAEKLKEFNQIIYKPLLLKLRRDLYGKKGLILLDSALIAESNMTYLTNNNIILVSTTIENQLNRLKERAYSENQIEQRINTQYSYDLKEEYIKNTIAKDNHGNIYKFENSLNENESKLKKLFDDIIKEFVTI